MTRPLEDFEHAKGGRRWHRVGRVSEMGSGYSLHTLCGAQGEHIAEVGVHVPEARCARCVASDGSSS